MEHARRDVVDANYEPSLIVFLMSLVLVVVDLQWT